MNDHHRARDRTVEGHSSQDGAFVVDDDRLFLDRHREFDDLWAAGGNLLVFVDKGRSNERHLPARQGADIVSRLCHCRECGYRGRRGSRHGCSDEGFASRQHFDLLVICRFDKEVLCALHQSFFALAQTRPHRAASCGNLARPTPKGRVGAAPVECRLRQPRMETLRSNGNMTRVAKRSGNSPRSRRLLRADDGGFCGKGLVVRLGGLEPPTSGSTIRRSNQLSYNRTSLPGASPPDAASAFTDEALPHLAAQYGQSADISRLLRLASTLPVDEVRRRERRCDGCNQGKEKGRGRRSGLFPMNGQREEVLA